MAVINSKSCLCIMVTPLMSRRPRKVPEMFGQEPSPSKDPRLDRAYWNVECLGNSLQREAFQVTQHNCHPELGGQIRQSSVEVRAELDRPQCVLAAVVGRVACLRQWLNPR